MSIKLTIKRFKRSQYSSHSEYRNAIEAHLKLALKDRSVINIETQIKIEFNKAGIEKMVSKIGDVKAIALCNLQLILKNAKFIEQQTDKRERQIILSVLLFKTNVGIDDCVYEVWCYIRHQENGHFLYSLNIDAKNALG